MSSRTLLLIAAALAAPSVASSVAAADANVTVTLSPTGDALAASIGETSASLSAKLKSQIDDAYQTANLPGFLRSFTDATAFSQRGLGVDYVSVPSSLMVGIGGNVALASGDVLTADRPTAGAAANVGAMVGANLGVLDLPRWTVFANGFYQGASTDRLTGHLTSAAAHAQYRLIEAERTGGTAVLLRWIGLDVTSGLELTRWSLDGKVPMTNDFTIAGAGASAAVTLSSTGTFHLASSAITIPVEVTTGVRLFELLSIYGGVGMDFSTGSSSVDANLTGDLKSKDGATSYGTATITASGSNTASPAAFRALAGVQANLAWLKIFVQGNVSQTPAASVCFGLRLIL
jgi:hypothetical protein